MNNYLVLNNEIYKNIVLDNKATRYYINSKGDVYDAHKQEYCYDTKIRIRTNEKDTTVSVKRLLNSVWTDTHKDNIEAIKGLIDKL